MHILFDIGGTKMRVATSIDGATLGEVIIRPTPAEDFTEGMRVFADAVRELSRGERVVNAAGGIAGPYTQNHEETLAHHLPGWKGRPLRRECERILGCPVRLENDAALAGLGEAHAGAGMGEGIMAYLTVSTGVGGARIVDGRIDESRFGFEIGRHIVDRKDALSHGDGTIENLISGSAFEEQYGKKPYEVDDPAAWDNAAGNLAVALVNIALFWSPDVIVVGGSMVTGDPAIPLTDTIRHYERLLTVFDGRPAVKKASLGDLGGLHGALVLLGTNGA